jgi:hypothetical protein
MTHRFESLRVRFIDEDLDLRAIAREFPSVLVEHSALPSGIVVDDYVWRGAFDLRSLDEKVASAGQTPILTIRGHDPVRVAIEVLSRYQHFIQRRNPASSVQVFDEVLRVHEGLHDLSVEIEKSDFEHALDTWQWVLRLAPQADLAIQIAALFHDFDRLGADTRERLEHRAPEQRGIRPAGRGTTRVYEMLMRIGMKRETTGRVCDILDHDELRVAESELALLNDADALSFLSLNSATYVDYFGLAQTRRKVAYTLSRLGAEAKTKLEHVRLRPDVERLLHEVAA